MKKLDNQGFSLVELIIVIGVMAILAAALAPQLMKYIEKSRVSADASTCASIESCVNAALTEDHVWTDVSHNWRSGKEELYFYVTRDPDSDALFFKGIATSGNFRRTLEPMLSDLKYPKQTGMKSYKVMIKLGTSEKTGADGTSNGTLYTVKGVDVETSSYEIEDDTQHIFSLEE